MFGLVPFAMRNDVDTMDNVFDRMVNVFDEPFMSGFHTPEFKVDVKDNGDSYDLTAELPGFQKGNITLTYKDNYLTIGAKNETSSDEKDEQGNYVRRERSQSSVSRSFYIDNIDETKLDAEFKDGVLKVTLPKAVAPQEESPKEIPIRTV